MKKSKPGVRYFAASETDKDQTSQSADNAKSSNSNNASAGEEIREKLQKWKEKKSQKNQEGKFSGVQNENYKEQKDFGADKIVFEPELDVSAKTLENRKARQRNKERKKLYKLAAQKEKEMGANEEFEDGPVIQKYQPKGKKSSRDPFPGDAPISPTKIEKYKRGKDMKTRGMHTKFARNKFKEKEKKIQFAYKQAARSEMLMNEEAGYLEADEGEDTTLITQHDIVEAVDISSAQKYFDLKLPEFGPYRMNYTRNGRFLLIGGNRGHVASIEWQSKRLMCEMNVMETVNDVKWLHQETMFAVAQKQWTYIYDNQGLELHCLKMLPNVLRMEFLPFHFLLATANSKGYLSWLDVSVGQQVAGHKTGQDTHVMCQNPQNAILCLGHTGGTVTMWSPNVKEPLVKMLCHGIGVRSVAVDKTGQYMATSGMDRKVKIWDVRNFKMLQSYKIGSGAGSMAFSQTGLLALGKGNVVEVYKDCCRQTVTKPYLIHKLSTTITDLQFCPYEDVLGVGHGLGFTSLLIPGAGEANFDALEANPFQSKAQRREAEVQMLLDKIPAEMIHLDTGKIGQLDTKSYEDRVQEHNKVHFLKPKSTHFEPKYKMKGRNKTGRKENRKNAVQEEQKKEVIRELMKEKQKLERQNAQDKSRTSDSVLDRFKKAKT